MNTITTLFALLAVAAPALSPDVTYEIRPTYTSITFQVTKWMVMRQEGMFRECSGSLTYDPAHPERARLDVTVQAASLDTRNSGRDKVLRSDDFFDVEKYPALSFHSASVTPSGAGSLRVTGDLTIHGVTRSVALPVKINGTHEVPNVGKLAGFETTFTINRRDYGVLGAKWGAIPTSISDEVEIHILLGAIMPKK